MQTFLSPSEALCNSFPSDFYQGLLPAHLPLFSPLCLTEWARGCHLNKEFIFCLVPMLAAVQMTESRVAIKDSWPQCQWELCWVSLTTADVSYLHLEYFHQLAPQFVSILKMEISSLAFSRAPFVSVLIRRDDRNWKEWKFVSLHKVTAKPPGLLRPSEPKQPSEDALAFWLTCATPLLQVIPLLFFAFYSPPHPYFPCQDISQHAKLFLQFCIYNFIFIIKQSKRAFHYYSWL